MPDNPSFAVLTRSAVVSGSVRAAVADDLTGGVHILPRGSLTSSELPVDPEDVVMICIEMDDRAAEGLAVEVSRRWECETLAFALTPGWSRRLKARVTGSVDDVLRAELKDRIEYRLAQHLERPVEHDGDTFRSDPRSREMMGGIISRVSRTGDLPSGWLGWRSEANELYWANESPSAVADHLGAIMDVLSERVQLLYGLSWQTKAAVDEADSEQLKDMAEDDSILFSDWPD